MRYAMQFAVLTIVAGMLILGGPVGWVVLFLTRKSRFWVVV